VKNYNPITKARDIVEESTKTTAQLLKRPVKPVAKRENISTHEAGLRKLEEEARQNQLRRRKMKRG